MMINLFRDSYVCLILYENHCQYLIEFDFIQDGYFYVIPFHFKPLCQ